MFDMFVPILLLLVFFPLVFSTGHLTLTIKSEIDQEITVIITSENLYHGFMRNLTQWKEEVLIHHNLTLGKLYNISIVTKERTGESHTLLEHGFPALRGIYEAEAEYMFLRKLVLKVACDQDFHGTFCDKFCDKKVASSLGKHCNINGTMEHNKTECINGVSCQRTRAMHQCNRFFSLQTCEALMNMSKFFGMI